MILGGDNIIHILTQYIGESFPEPEVVHPDLMIFLEWMDTDKVKFIMADADHLNIPRPFVRLNNQKMIVLL